MEERAVVSDKLIAEGNERLKTALENGYITEARVAQNIITAGITNNEELKVKKNEFRSLSAIVNKRKNNLIINIVNKNLRKVHL